MAKRRRPTPARRAHIKAKQRMWKQRMHDLDHGNARTPHDGWYLHCRGVIQRRLDYWSQELVKPRKEPRMRRHVEEVTPAPVKEELPWRVALGSLRFGDRMYARGSVVPDDLVEACANGQRLIQSGYLRRLPAARAKQAKTEPPPAEAVPYVPVDHIRVLYDAMSALAAQRKCAIGDLEDVVDRTLWERATKQFVDDPQMAMSTGWGGNNRPTRSGDGTARRIFDLQAFRKRLYGYGKEMVA